MTTGQDPLALIELRLKELPPAGLDVKGAGTAVALSRFAEGLTNEQELRGELSGLGARGPALENLVLQAQLRRGLNVYQDQRAALTAELRSARLAQSAYRTIMERLGAEPDEIERQLLLASEAPVAEVVPSSEIGIRVLAAEQLPARPGAAPTEVTLRVLAAEEISAEVVAAAPAELGLSIIAAEEVPAGAVAEPAQLGISIIKAEEA